MFTQLLEAPPAQGDYIRVKARAWNDAGTRLMLPFGRYYMQEFQAPKAERAYQNAQRSGGAVLAVRVLDGSSVVEGLFIDDLPIEEYLRR